MADEREFPYISDEREAPYPADERESPVSPDLGAEVPAASAETVRPLPDPSHMVLAEVDLDSGSRYYSFEGVSTSTNYYEDKIIAAGRVSREIPLLPGEMRISDAACTFATEDGHFQVLKAAEPFRNRVFRYRFGDPMKGWSDLITVFTGRIVDADFGGHSLAELEMAVRDASWDRLRMPIAGRLSRVDFPDLPADAELVLAPIIYGTVSSASNSAVGACPCYLVTSTTPYRYLVAQHECKSIVNVYRYGTLLDPGDYSVTTTAIGTRTYTFIDFDTDQRARQSLPGAVNNGAGYAIGASSMNVDGVLNNLVIDAGDEFQCYGDQTVYVVSAGNQASGAGAITALAFAPALVKAVVDDQRIDFLNKGDYERTGEHEITADVQGTTDTGLTAGTLLTNPVDQVEDFLLNYCDVGASELEAADWAAAAALATASAYVGGAWIGGTDVTRLSVIDAYGKSFLMPVYTTREGLFSCAIWIADSFYNLAGGYDDLSDQEEIVGRTMRVRSNRDVASHLQYSYMRNWARDFDEVVQTQENTDEETNLGQQITVTAELPYVRDELTANKVAAARLLFLAEAVQFAELELPISQYERDLADYVTLTHRRGIAADGLGYRGETFLVTGLTLDFQPRSMRVALGAVKVPDDHCDSYADEHTDSEHADEAAVNTAAVDSHTDSEHADTPHADQAAANDPHADVAAVAHGDEAHADESYGEGGPPHEDTPHIDIAEVTHSDTPHADDAHQDIAAVSTAHGDSYTDTPAVNIAHQDESHQDTDHNDFHGDSDTPYTDSGHTDIAYAVT